MAVIALLVIAGLVVFIVIGLMFLGVLGSGRTPSEAVRETPPVELLGPGGPDDPEGDKNQIPANDPEAPAQHHVSRTG